MILEAFEHGDPRRVWESVQALLHDVRSFAHEAARDRFRQNLGTPVCRDCDGLKAGPGVVATCFQLEECFYTNKREDDVTSTQLHAIARLTRTIK